MKSAIASGLSLGGLLIFLVLTGILLSLTTALAMLFGGAQPGSIHVGITLTTLVFLSAMYSSRSLLSGGLMGFASGLLLATFVLLVDWLSLSGVNLRSYLVALTPESITLLIGGNAPAALVATYSLHAAIAGALGGAAGRWLAASSSRLHRIRLPHLPSASLGTGTRRTVCISVGLLLLLLLPTQLSSYWTYNLGTIGIYVLLGLGLNIVVGKAGLLDLGYVAFFAIGAYTMALLTAPTPLGIQWGFWAVLPIGIALAALAGILLGLPVLRLRGDYLAIVTLGFGEIIHILSKSDALIDFTGGPRGVRDVGGPPFFGIEADRELVFLYLILLACFCAAWMTSRLNSSRVGRAWVAMREDEMVAQAVGVNTWQYKLMAFAMGAGFAGLGGALFASRNEFTGPEDHTLLVSINVLALVIVGGMDSIPGVILGALVLKGLPELLRGLDSYRLLVFGALLVVMMIFRPEGLWPSAQRRRELHTHPEPDAQEGTAS